MTVCQSLITSDTVSNLIRFSSSPLHSLLSPSPLALTTYQRGCAFGVRGEGAPHFEIPIACIGDGRLHHTVEALTTTRHKVGVLPQHIRYQRAESGKGKRKGKKQKP